MWTTMMITMMQPALIPLLWPRLKEFRESEMCYGSAVIACVTIGYFSIWAFVGALVFMLAAALGIVANHVPAISRVIPQGAGFALLVVGMLQFTPWKKRHRHACTHMPCADITTLKSAFRRGVSLGIHCAASCLGLTCLLVINGIMDWSTMVFATTTVMWERLLSNDQRATSVVGFCLLAMGLFLVLTPAGLR
jgi:predicted metal-binding membrane protein